MGRIKDLRDKVAKGEASDEEVAELKELETEAVEVKSETKSEDEEVDALASKLVEAATSAAETRIKEVDSKLDKVLKALEPQAAVTKETGFIVDKTMGRVSVDKLAETMVQVPGRENKVNKEVSMKTVHFIDALLQNDVQKLQLLVEGTDSRGGFVVPTEFANMLIEDRRDATVMRQVASQMTIGSDSINLPSLASRPKAAWRSEAAVKHTSTVDFGNQTFTPHSLAVIVGLSNELVADASLGVGNIVQYVANLMTRSIAEEEDKAFFTGNGSGKPTGLNTYSFATVSGAGGAADAIISAFYRLGQGYRPNAVWVANSATIESIAKLKDGNNNYLLQPLANTPTFTLRGRPVYEQNDLENGSLFVGDFNFYQIVDREGISVRVSDEATVAGSSAFEKNLTYVRVETRTDGEVTFTNAFREVTGL